MQASISQMVDVYKELCKLPGQKRDYYHGTELVDKELGKYYIMNLFYKYE